MNHFGLKNGSLFVLVEAAGGVYNADALTRVCEVADAHSAFLKVTEDQRIGFMVAEDALAGVAESLQAHGLFVRPYRRPGVPSPKACLGELCPHAEQDALGDALELSSRLAENAAGHDDTQRPYVSLGLNGCWQSCAASGLDDVHIVGEASGYKVSVGGKASEIPQLGQFLCDNVPRERLPEVVQTVLDIFYRNADNAERLADVVERIGLSEFSDAVDAVLRGTSTDEDLSPSETGALDSFDDIPFEDVDANDLSLADQEGNAVSDNSDTEPASAQHDDIGALDEGEDLVSEVVSLGEEEHEIDAPEHEPEPEQSSYEEEEALLESDGLDIEDASAEDLVRVTSAIRAEVESDRGAGDSTDDVDSEILAFESARTAKAPVAPAARSQQGVRTKQASRLSVQLEGDVLALCLPDGTALKCPLPTFEVGGLVLELHTAAGLVRVSRSEGVVNVAVGALEFVLPFALSKAA